MSDPIFLPYFPDPIFHFPALTLFSFPGHALRQGTLSFLVNNSPVISCTISSRNEFASMLQKPRRPSMVGFLSTKVGLWP